MNIVQLKHQNRDAKNPLIIPVLVLPNTPEEEVDQHIIENSKKNLEWLYASEPHEGVAILCGGGPSIKDHLNDIRRLKDNGGKVFGLNGAAKWLIENGVEVDYQVIIDAKQETSILVEPRAKRHIFSSQCHPDTVDSVTPIIFHLNNINIENLFPPEKVEAGGYTLVGGGVSVGITTLVLSFVMGYRNLHVFGYDSSHVDSTHAYEQPMNQFIPHCKVEWGNKVYTCQMALKHQAEAFPTWARELQQNGCVIEVYGKGLLQAMWFEPPANEKQKYKLMWSHKIYREVSPGELSVDKFIEVMQPHGRVIDFGCGTGRGGKQIKEKTDCEVILIDFADNCRDEDTKYLPFIEWDLSEPMPATGSCGYCTDVMEHIPAEQINEVIENIMECVPECFFQISLVNDCCGSLIGQKLHLSVHDFDWWRHKFEELGYSVMWSEDLGIDGQYHISTT